MPAAQVDEYKVMQIKTLGKQKDAEARELLEHVAKQVQPIMRKRKWRVYVLSEFTPRSPNLLGLNVNRGREVKIRLRPAGREDSFYDWNHILGTMLHELCHNKIGPHNAEFYKLLDELWTEAEELMDKGITGTGQGFDAPSAGRLGSHAFIPLHNPPDHKMADAIRKAAEARAKQQSIMPSGPCKLGGGTSYKNLTPAQAAAAAAERRARDNLWCGAEHSAEQVDQEVGTGSGSRNNSRGASPAATTTATAAPGTTVTAVANVQVSQHHPRKPSDQLGRSHSTGTAPGHTAARLPALGAGSLAAVAQQQPHQQTGQQQQHPKPSRQDDLLQQEWQMHVQRQRQQRWQQQEQQHRSRKRAAAESIDLTISDDENEQYIGGTLSEAAAAAVENDASAACPCCAGLVLPWNGAVGEGTAATGRGLSAPLEAWCAKHRQQRQQQQLDRRKQQQQLHDGQGKSGGWVCQVCTLANKPLVLQCEACLSVRNA